VRAECFFVDCECSPIERFSRIVFFFVVIESREIDDNRADIGILRSERLLGDCERSLIERFGRRVVPLIAMKRGQIVETGADLAPSVQARAQLRLIYGGLKEPLGLRVLLLLQGPASRGHLLLPASLFLFKPLQEDIAAVGRQDWTHIARVQTGERVLEFFFQVRDSECSEVSACTSGGVRRVLPRELFKRFALLYAAAKVSSFGLRLHKDHPQAEAVRRCKQDEEKCQPARTHTTARTA